MKKLILSLSVLAFAVSANAFGLSEIKNLPPVTNPDYTTFEIPAGLVNKADNNRFRSPASRATAGEVLYMPSYDPYYAIGFNGQTPGMQIGQALQLDPDMIKNLTDAEITKIIFYTGTDNVTKTNTIKKYTVFISNDLTADPIYTQSVTCTETPFARIETTLDTPFKIEAGKKIFVGAYCTINAESNSPVVIDYSGHMDNFGGWVGIRQNSRSAWSWDNITSDFGFACVGACIKSDNLPENNVSISVIDGKPVSYVNEEFEVDFLFKNNGVNEVSNITVEYGFDGQQSRTKVIDGFNPVGYQLDEVVGIFDVVSTEAGLQKNVNIRITEVNGQPNEAIETYTFPVTIVPTGKGFDRNVVLEEFTSIFCQYCPAGYTAMEYVNENYKDGDLIPVCIHVNSMGAEPMNAASFNNVVSKFNTNGVPDAIMNRRYTLFPAINQITGMFEAIRSMPAIANVEANASFDTETRTLNIDTETSFSFDYTDGDKTFALCYAITENNVGPYDQINGYSGTTGNTGWEKQPSPVSLIYNDVARQLNTYVGITGSIPATITAGELNKFSYNLKVVQAVGNVDNMNLVVYLRNKKTGEIENACTVKSNKIAGLSGIDDVIIDSTNSSDKIEYFNLQGIRVTEPANGIYIRRQGNKVDKIVLR